MPRLALVLKGSPNWRSGLSILSILNRALPTPCCAAAPRCPVLTRISTAHARCHWLWPSLREEAGRELPRIPTRSAFSEFLLKMSVNSYRKGCHLLNHDDVIGTRRVSYILYLPIGPGGDRSWKPEWGGALELYPVHAVGDALQPDSAPSLIIPPSWNQVRTG